MSNSARAQGKQGMAATSVAAICLSVSMLMSLIGCASLRAGPVDDTGADAGGLVASEVLAIDSLHISAAGRLVDLRYRVLDPERAQATLGAKVYPMLIDEATGVEMGVPTTAKLGSLRQTQGEQRTGRTYFVLFLNSAGVRRGSRVTAVLGDLRYPHLEVQ